MTRKTRALRFKDEASARAALQLPSHVTLPAAPPDKPHKYRAQACTVDGIRFDSKREARYYERLKLRQRAGEVMFWLRQTPLHLPGGTKLVVDFVEIAAAVELMIDGRVVRVPMCDVLAAGGVRFVDAKGVETQTFRVKRREVHHHYPIRVETV